ncbi:MAG: hypothetical protein NT097_02985 [Actinobacteria bacterium]|nr:hypothetical protein [Actinomycetota bacterium]
MNLRSRTTRFVVAFAATLSLFAGVVAVPATSASASSAGVSAGASIGAKKKVLTTEQKNAKAALDKAIKDLKTKEKNLKAAVKAQKKTAKALAKATKAADTAQVRSINGGSKKAKAAAKKLASAKAKDDRALALVARRTVMRDTAQAKVIRLDAKYAWLIQDLSTLDCGVGTDVVTASGAVEHVWECGIVYKHEDGDTTHVKTTANKLVEVRNIGLQTPEMAKRNEKTKVLMPAQCGAKNAYENFKNLMPEEITIVQLRSIKNGVNGWGGGSRPTRSVYKLNNATGQFDIDVQAEQIKEGWSMWWPTATEWAHNKEYLDLMNDAKARGVGLWNPNLCGAAVGNAPLIWFNQNAPQIDNDAEPAFGEYVILKNDTDAEMNLSGWSLRDNSLNFFWSDNKELSWMQNRNRFSSLVIPPHEFKIIYLDNPAEYPLSSSESRYFDWGYSPGAQLTNGSIGAAFSANYINGDGIYLQDDKGNMRASMTNPCTGAAMCVTPAWVTEIFNRSGQLIPIPVALNKVANVSRDLYNPKVVIVSGAAKYISEYNPDFSAKTYADLAGKYLVQTGTPIDSAQPLGTLVDLSLTTNGTSVLNSRVSIADNTGRIQTTVYKRYASGNNTVPTLAGMTEAAARAAVIAAGFTVGTVTQTTVPGATGVTLQVESGTKTVGTRVSFTVNTPPVVP